MVRGHHEALTEFAAEEGFRGKGPLSVALVITQFAQKEGFPLRPGRLLAKSGTQVTGLSMHAVQRILKTHSIDKVMSREGGRTSRGSVVKMQKYVAFLNALNEQGPVDLQAVEKFWIERVHEFFAGKPFKIRLDASRSLRSVVKGVIEQAEERQRTTSGTYYAGAVLQHLVGAKLECLFGPDTVGHNSFSTADAPSDRVGDFFLGDVALHVTTSPSEALMLRCEDNLNDGLRPMIVTTQRGVPVAQGFAENRGTADRIDVFEIEQFVALNIYELGKFATEGRRTAVTSLVARYNQIVEEIETDPSMKIELKK